MNEPTEFEKKVYAAVKLIPKGEVRSYGWVARRIGRPKAARASATPSIKTPSRRSFPAIGLLPPMVSAVLPAGLKRKLDY